MQDAKQMLSLMLLLPIPKDGPEDWYWDLAARTMDAACPKYLSASSSVFCVANNAPEVAEVLATRFQKKYEREL